MGGTAPTGTSDDQQPPFIVDALAGLPPDTIIFYTIGGAPSPQPEHAARVGSLRPSPADSERLMVIATPYLNVRQARANEAKRLGTVPFGAWLNVTENVQADGYHWARIIDGPYAGGYVAREYLKAP